MVRLICSHIRALTTLQRRASLYGAKVALVEGSGRLGGTCVNVGEYASSSGLHTLIYLARKAVCQRR